MRRDQSDGQFLSSAKGKVPRKAEIQVHRNRTRGRGAFPGLGLLLGDVTIEDLLTLKACESKFFFFYQYQVIPLHGTEEEGRVV